jgi:hypothetical protein
MTQHEGILPLEAVAKIKSAAAERQANYRARKDRAKAKLKAEADVVNQTPDRFWAKNREIASQTKIATLLERESYILDIVQVMNETIQGEVELDAEFADLVAAEIREHGICETEIILLEFWREPELLAELKSNEATKVFCKYGVVTAVPGKSLHDFQTWMASRKPATQNFYTPLSVSMQCQCGAPPSSVTSAIADRYVEVNILYKCGNCIRGDAPFKAMVTEQRLPENDLHDSWGRVKDQGRT